MLCLFFTIIFYFGVWFYWFSWTIPLKLVCQYQLWVVLWWWSYFFKNICRVFKFLCGLRWDVMRWVVWNGSLLEHPKNKILKYRFKESCNPNEQAKAWANEENKTFWTWYLCIFMGVPESFTSPYLYIASVYHSNI